MITLRKIESFLRRALLIVSKNKLLAPTSFLNFVYDVRLMHLDRFTDEFMVLFIGGILGDFGPLVRNNGLIVNPLVEHGVFKQILHRRNVIA